MPETIMKKWNTIQGWFDQSDYQTYELFASMMPKNFRMLEIGSYKGRSTMAMIEICKAIGKTVWIDVIDTFRGDQHIGQTDTYQEFLDNTEGADTICVIRGDSKEMHKLFCTGTEYHLIYIDGAHDYDSVRWDIANYAPFLGKDSIIAGHDWYHFDVAKAVTDSPQITSPVIFHNSWFQQSKNI
jgi:predicted O-methyltransferase YrrM